MSSQAPFVSHDDLGEFLGRTVEASDNAALAAVDAACDICRTIAEQTFNEISEDEVTLDGSGTDALLLPELPVTDVSDVTLDDDALVADDDYMLNGNGILLRPALKVWPRKRQNVTVTYTHGYAAADLPRDVRMVALNIAARLYDQGIAASETLGASSVQYAVNATDLSNGEKAILRKYRQTT